MVQSQLRTYYKPPFHTYGEFVAFFGQICDVRCSRSPVNFDCIAQLFRGFNLCTRITSLIGICLFLILFKLVILFVRDCTSENIMLDPSRMYPKSFHPMEIERTREFRGKVKGHTRTRCPPRYFLIDLGLSRKYDPENGPPLETPLRDGDKSAPEHRDMERPCNPFPTDVYYLGNLVREDYIQVRISIHSQVRPF